MVSPNFLQWTSAGSVWGLNFADTENASQFCRRIEQVIEAVIAAKGGEEEEKKDEDGGEANAASNTNTADAASSEGPSVNASEQGESTESESEQQKSGDVLVAPPSIGVPTVTTKTNSAGEEVRINPLVANARTSGLLASGGRKSFGESLAGAQKLARTSSEQTAPSDNTPDLSSSPVSVNPTGGVVKLSADAFGAGGQSTESPKPGRPGRFVTTLRTSGSQGTVRKTSDASDKPKLASGSINSPSTLRFKKKSWRDSVDLGTPRSVTLAQLDGQSSTESQGLLKKDPAGLTTRERVIKELCTTELSYCKGLQQIVKVCVPLLSVHKAFKPEQQSTIFGNIEDIYTVNTLLLGRLFANVSTWDDGTTTVGDVLLSSINTFKPYATYLAEYSTALKLLEELEQKKKPVAAYTQACQEECGGLTLTSLLVTPVQRIPRYILLLQEAIKYTPETHPDLKNLTEALVSVKKYAEEVNKTVKLTENKKEFTRLSGIIEGLGVIKSPLLWSDETIRAAAEPDQFGWMILFSDRLIFVRDNAIGLELPLHYVWVKNVPSKLDLTLHIVSPDRKVIVETDIPQNKHQWIERLEAAIMAEVKERDYLDPEGEGTRRFAFKWALRDNSVAIYQGQWRDALPHGNGKFKYSSKSSYEGSFAKGRRHGQGKMIYPTGDILEGTWEEDVPNGKGKLVSVACEYEGDFSKGSFTGSGTIKHADGSVYVGEFLNGQYHGQGELKDAGGSVYTGQWKDGRRHGTGKLVSSLGGSYEGSWADDQYDGDGVLRLASGAVYNGTFAEGLLSGTGSYENPDGTTYKGLFQNGLFDGLGVLKDPDGAQYQGQFLEGKRSGKGFQQFKDGSSYEGEWQGGRKHGQGKFITQLVVYEGAWESDCYHGRGKLIEVATNRVLYDGHWKNGKKDGKGYCIYSDGTKYTGGFVNDMRDGIGVMESATHGWKFGGSWSKNKRHGHGELTAPNYRFEGEWVNDRRTGPGKEKFPEQFVTFEGEFLNDKRVKGKILVEAPGKIPFVSEIDYENSNTQTASILTKMPLPVVGIQMLIFN